VGALHPINWRSKYASLEVNEAKRLRELESKSAKLKKLLADKLLEVEAMKDVLSKKWRSLTGRSRSRRGW
jgi:putative transposase